MARTNEAKRRQTGNGGDTTTCSPCGARQGQISVHLTHRELLDLYGALTELSSRRTAPGPERSSLGADHTALAIALNRRRLRDHADALDDARTAMINELSGGTGVVTDTIMDEETGQVRINPRAVEFRERYRSLLTEPAGWFTLNTISYECVTPHSACTHSGAQSCECPCHAMMQPSVIEGLLPILVSDSGVLLHCDMGGAE